MNKKEILAFKTSKVTSPKSEMILQLEKWSPTTINLVPPGKPNQYFIFSLFFFIGIFKRDNYFYYRFFDKTKLASSFLVVPRFFKWPYMDKGAVQFTYVMTSSNYRGRGLAWQGIYKAYNDLKKNGINQFWYITDSENLASQRLAEKMGFELVGKLEPTKRFFGIIKTLKLNENK